MTNDQLNRLKSHAHLVAAIGTARAVYNEELHRPIDDSGLAAILQRVVLDGWDALDMRGWVRDGDEWKGQHADFAGMPVEDHLPPHDHRPPRPPLDIRTISSNFLALRMPGAVDNGPGDYEMRGDRDTDRTFLSWHEWDYDRRARALDDYTSAGFTHVPFTVMPQDPNWTEDAFERDVLPSVFERSEQLRAAGCCWLHLLVD